MTQKSAKRCRETSAAARVTNTSSMPFVNWPRKEDRCDEVSFYRPDIRCGRPSMSTIDTSSIELRPKLVGQRIKRTEDPRLLAGAGRYVDDITPQHTLHMA